LDKDFVFLSTFVLWRSTLDRPLAVIRDHHAGNIDLPYARKDATVQPCGPASASNSSARRWSASTSGLFSMFAVLSLRISGELGSKHVPRRSERHNSGNIALSTARPRIVSASRSNG